MQISQSHPTKPHKDISRQTQKFNLLVKRKVGRPVNTWRTTLYNELGSITWNEVKRKAKHRNKWKDI